MQLVLVARSLAGPLRLVRKGVGLALVMAACTAPAYADFPNPNATPEIDPGSLTSGLALLVGGLLFMVDRCRSR